MKKIIFLIVCILLFSIRIYGEENPYKWTTQDSILQGAFYSICIIDWMQTNYNHKHPEKYREGNPLLGKYPSRARYTTFGISCMVLQTGIAYFLPKPYRGYWQFFMIGFEGYNVCKTFTIHSQMSF